MPGAFNNSSKCWREARSYIRKKLNPPYMDKKYSLNEIKAEVKLLAAQVGVPTDLLPTYGYSNDGARPHIEVDSLGYHYVVVERGQELSRMTTTDLDELLYHVFGDLTFGLACKYELEQRVENQDSRRLIFKHQVELLSILSPEWGELKAQEHEKILEQHPYDDQAYIRMELAKTLREQGLSPEAAWRKACEKYPLPEA